MKKATLIFATLLILLGFTFEDDLSEKIVNQIEKYGSIYPQEKAYLHLDKPYYLAGETLWLKTYVVEAESNMLDTLSVPLYVDLIDNQAGKIIETKTLKLVNGTANADFRLPDNLSAGIYCLRAYTNWMRNFDESLFFTKDFQVFDSNTSNSTEKLNPELIDFQFFPEGGALVEGLESQLGYKAIDAVGNGLDVSGIILSSKGDTVINFESEHLGMGIIPFTPEIGEKYTAKVKYRKVFEKVFQLPEIQKQGIVMSVSANEKDFIRVLVKHNIPNLNGQYALVGLSQGRVGFAAKTQMNKKGFLVKIPKEKFPQGVVQLTLFDEKSMPICERLLFLKKDNTTTINISSNKKTYSPREPVTLDIEAKDKDGKPVQGDYSLVVTDGKQVSSNGNEENILTYLLLSSDVKGRIEAPNYYFSAESPDVTQHLDMLMLTQGWRRFKWQDVMKPEIQAPKFYIERSLGISGQISRPNGKVFEKPINLTFMVLAKDSNRNFAMGEAGKDGTFSLLGLDFADSAKVMIQAIAGKANRNTKININPFISPKVEIVKIPFNPVIVDEKDLANYLKRTTDALELEKKLRLEQIQLLKEIVIKAKKLPQIKDERVIYDRASNSLKIDDSMMGYLNVLDMMRGRIPGVQVTGDAINPKVTIRGIGSLSGSTDPIFLLDGMRVDQSTITTLPITDVEKVDVLKGADAAIYGIGSANGVISVLTKRGNPTYDWSKDKTEGMEVIDIAGYYAGREFYAPKYDKDLPEHIRPDYRSTVFWSPNVKTDANGKAKLTFFNTDAETTMNVSLEGISSKGIAGIAKTAYTVKK